MEIEPATQGDDGLLAGGWDWLKDLPKKYKNQLLKVEKSIKELGQDDPRRIIHSLKVGLPLTVVSLLYYLGPLYDGFGGSGLWAIITVALVSEFTVGATLGKIFNRTVGTLFTGALAIGVQHLACLCGEKGRPIVFTIIIFLLVEAASFTRFFPWIQARYDYGMAVFILTFRMIAASGYRTDDTFQVAHERFFTVLIGEAISIIISIFVCPAWAGQDLHNIERLANYLEGFGNKYFQDSENEACKMAFTGDKAVLQGYESVLHSKSDEESLDEFARWEPRHVHFFFRYPWKQYLKIGALARECGYSIEALNRHINSYVEVPLELRNRIQEPSARLISESSKTLKALASAMKTMTKPSSANLHVENSKTAVDDLNSALQLALLENTDVLGAIPITSIASILTELTGSVEKISESVHELSDLADFKRVEPIVSLDKPQIHDCGSVKPVSDGDNEHVIIMMETTDLDPLDNEVSGPPTADASQTLEAGQ